MASKEHPRLSAICLKAVGAALASPIIILLLSAVLVAQAGHAQTFNILHSFNGVNSSGANPYAGLIRDHAGNLYGTTLNNGGVGGTGIVFKLNPGGELTILHSFGSYGDGINPYGGLVRDSSGNLYGMTPWGKGRKSALGIVYRVSSSGKEAKPHVFAGAPSDGSNPYGGLIRDQTGTLYGTTQTGGSTNGCGIVFKIKSGVETVLYNFAYDGSNGEGCSGAGDLVRDEAGNLYGTTSFGGNQPGCGTVFKLDTTGKETVLHAFDCLHGTDGSNPHAGLTLDQAGHLYGTTANSSPTGMGTVFKIDTTGNNYSTLHIFSGGDDGAIPMGPVVRDKAGNLYGTTRYGGNLSCGAPHGCGVVFQLSPKGKETVLHTFSGPDGMVPSSGLIRDGAGNLYGTAPRGGNTNCPSGCGVIFKITL
jgi:uncharacterized repeat protein (TIGR03803 family)